MESLQQNAAQFDINPSSLSQEQRDQLESAKARIPNYDSSLTLTENMNKELDLTQHALSVLEEKISSKRDKANTLASDQSAGSPGSENSVASDDSEGSENSVASGGSAGSPVMNNPLNNQTPTEFVHELESCSPMEIMPDDD